MTPFWRSSRPDASTGRSALRHAWRWLRAPVSGMLISLALTVLLLLGCQERLIYFPPHHAAGLVVSGPIPLL